LAKFPFSEKRGSQSTVLIVNLELIGDYIVFEPRRNTYHNFLLRISEPDEERMGPLIDKEMEESCKSGKAQRSREEIVRGLKQQVEVFAGFKAEINITRPDCARQLDVLTSYEGVAPVDIVVDADGQRIAAKVYIFESLKKSGKPPENYINVMLLGLKQHDYREEVIEEVEKAVTNLTP